MLFFLVSLFFGIRSRVIVHGHGLDNLSDRKSEIQRRNTNLEKEGTLVDDDNAMADVQLSDEVIEVITTN